MFKQTLFASLVAFLLLVVPAKAWDVVPGSAADDCTFDAGYNLCFVDLASDTFSTMMNTNICENWSFHWISLITGTTHLNTVNVRWSIASTIHVNTSGIANNTTLTGDPATGLDVLAGYDAPWVYLDIAVYTAGTGRGSLQCFKRRW